MNDPQKAPPLPEEIGVAYFCQRLDFCRDAGIPLTHELLTTHVTGAILVTASAAKEDNELKDHLLVWAGDRILGLVSMVARKAARPCAEVTETDYCPL